MFNFCALLDKKVKIQKNKTKKIMEAIYSFVFFLDYAHFDK